MASAVLERGREIDYEELHTMIGHFGQDVTLNAAKHCGWIVKGQCQPCEEFHVLKVKQENPTKVKVERSSMPGERFFLDTSSIKHKSLGGNDFLGATAR